MNFNVSKYIKRRKGADDDKFLTISTEDFDKDDEFIEAIQEKGCINDVKVKISGGTVCKK